MSLLEAIILGVIQGLTEFLPVSSSGHLAVGEKLLDFKGPESVAFDVLVHAATVVAILAVILPDIIRMLRTELRTVVMLVIASLPAGLAGFLLEPHIEFIKENMLVVGILFIVTASALVLAKAFSSDEKELGRVGILDSLIIGVFQAAAILPGISRSGFTISSARMMGVKPRAAFNFSFMLGVAAISGATLVKARDIGSLEGTLGMGVLVAAFVAALVSGVAALLVFRKIVVAGKLHYFSWYLVPLGIGTIIFHFLSAR